MIIDKKCTCGSKSTGDTTIRCCNLCGLPMPNEPWHFNLDENIFSQVEKPVLNKMLQERANGGLKKIEEFKPCLSPEHQPPSHIVLSPGKYEYTCPACGEKTVFTVPSITW